MLAQIDVGVEPEGMAVSPDGKWAVNTSETTNMLHWIDTSTNQLVDNTGRPAPSPRGIHQGQQAALGLGRDRRNGQRGGRGQARNPQDPDLQDQGVHPDKVQPVGIKLTSDGKYAFIALGPANHIAVVDAKTYEVLDYLLVGRRVWHMAFNPDESLLLTTNGVSGDVSVIDVAKLKVTKSIKVGRYPGCGGHAMSALEVSDVAFAYGARRALDGVSSPLPKRFTALLGPNGAGKSTLIALLTRLYDLQRGQIRIAGFGLREAPRQALARLGVVFQQSTLTST